MGAWSCASTTARCAPREQHGVFAELAASNRVASWAYGQTEAARGLTWLRADEMVPGRGALLAPKADPQARLQPARGPRLRRPGVQPIRVQTEGPRACGG